MNPVVLIVLTVIVLGVGLLAYIQCQISASNEHKMREELRRKAEDVGLVLQAQGIGREVLQGLENQYPHMFVCHRNAEILAHSKLKHVKLPYGNAKDSTSPMYEPWDEVEEAVKSGGDFVGYALGAGRKQVVYVHPVKGTPYIVGVGTTLKK